MGDIAPNTEVTRIENGTKVIEMIFVVSNIKTPFCSNNFFLSFESQAQEFEESAAMMALFADILVSVNTMW